jgi:predicted lipoprotein with Yx(FWY)xxD motif
MTIRVVILAAALALPGAAFGALVIQGNSDKGPVLTDDRGMTLYTFDKDEPGKSMCVDACAQNWPPLKADAGAKATGEYSIIKRPDGSMQWAHRGKPLYLWSKDSKPGDTMGDGFKDLWHVARP